MDSGTIIISVILIVMVILPFIFTGSKFRKQKKQLVNMLNNLAEQNQVKLSNYEAGGSFGIGLDQNSRCLFFARIVEGEITGRSIVLAEMSRCKMKTSSRLLEHGEKVIDRVELALYPVSSAQPEIVLEMYNSEYDTLTIRGELLSATRWEQMVSNALKEVKKSERKPVSSKQAVFA